MLYFLLFLESHNKNFNITFNIDLIPLLYSFITISTLAFYLFVIRVEDIPSVPDLYIRSIFESSAFAFTCAFSRPNASNMRLRAFSSRAGECKI